MWVSDDLELVNAKLKIANKLLNFKRNVFFKRTWKQNTQIMLRNQENVNIATSIQKGT